MTFTVLARDVDRGLIGAATASRSLAVGASVLALDPGVGVVASQAWTNRALRGRLLAELRDGVSAERAVSRVTEWDGESKLRQVALLGWSGRGAARSGVGISGWAGHRVEADAVIAGNLLTGSEVVEAMASAGEQALDDFAERLIAVLAAGDAAGGDVRGRQSAALLVASRREVVLDLRVDDHVDPVAELARLWTLANRSGDSSSSL